MTFDKIRAVGVSLLTSAGIAGIIVGFAAQKSLGMILAGIQLAITQPIRLDDSVIVEGEMGVIEEIKLTYVVVRLWDQRRLILPVTYFLEKPFQNWTINSAQLLGTVVLVSRLRHAAGSPAQGDRKDIERSPEMGRTRLERAGDRHERTLHGGAGAVQQQRFGLAVGPFGRCSGKTFEISSRQLSGLFRQDEDHGCGTGGQGRFCRCMIFPFGSADRPDGCGVRVLFRMGGGSAFRPPAVSFLNALGA